MPIAQRIESLKVVAERAKDGADWSYPFRDFLDGFYERPNPSGLMDEPPLLAGLLPNGLLIDAYLAGTAEHLCRHHGYPPPKWVFDKSRYLKEPWFGAKTHNLRMILLAESPVAFRSRDIFVSANALSRV